MRICKNMERICKKMNLLYRRSVRKRERKSPGGDFISKIKEEFVKMYKTALHIYITCVQMYKIANSMYILTN